MRAAAGLAWLTARTLFDGKRLSAAVLLGLLPAVVALSVAFSHPSTDGAQLFHGIAFFYSLRIMVFLLALVFGLAITSGEIEEGTVGYLYLGAAPRWLIVLIQTGVTAAALTLVSLGSLALTALAAGLAGGDLPHPVRSVAMMALLSSIAMLVSLSFTVTCGLALRRPLPVAATAIFFWEFLITQMPVKFAAWTLTNNIRSLFLNLVLDGERVRWMFRYVKNFRLPDYAEASMFLSLLAGLFLVTAMVAAMNRSIEGKEAR